LGVCHRHDIMKRVDNVCLCRTLLHAFVTSLLWILFICVISVQVTIYCMH